MIRWHSRELEKQRSLQHTSYYYSRLFLFDFLFCFSRGVCFIPCFATLKLCGIHGSIHSYEYYSRQQTVLTLSTTAAVVAISYVLPGISVHGQVYTKHGAHFLCTY